MEREALGVKEALMHFQLFIEGEQNIVITDHTMLQWAQTYKNANCCLAVWGAVFRVYLGLKIVHRAGVVHLNVDPLSRLKRILPHQSLVKDEMLSLPEQPPDQPLVAWQSQLDRLPAEKPPSSLLGHGSPKVPPTLLECPPSSQLLYPQNKRCSKPLQTEAKHQIPQAKAFSPPCFQSLSALCV
jgi:RNase H-like domain found in reverse transcriptase